MKKFGFSALSLLILFAAVSNSSAHVVLDYPLGGNTFVVGDKINIRWHISILHDQENWDLYFSPDGGTNWETIILNLPSTQLNYLWTLPAVVTERARIRIYMDNIGRDYDDISSDFTIQESTSSIQIGKEYPQIYVLHPNYPNPFNSSTIISYQLPRQSHVELAIYNMAGQIVTRLVSEQQSVGSYQYKWNAVGLASGLYFYRITAGEFTQVKKMILVN